MSDVAFGAVSAAVVLIMGVAAFSWSGRRMARRDMLAVVGTGALIIGLLVVLRAALPETPRTLAVALVGVTLSALLVWLAFRYSDRLPEAQTRRLVAFAVAGVIITILGAVYELAR